jgi:tRNA dimethylallyltransferase
LKELDPDICKILHPNNTHRILRAFEVVTFTGKSLAYWWNTNQTKKYDATSIVINPDRKILHQRILSRVHFMLENGAIDEVADFQKEFPNYSGSLTKVIGKNEIASFLNNEISRDQLIDQMFIKTRQYAKRQSTWFRNKMSAAEFIDDHRDIEKILIEICK